jgi:ferredoxin
MRALIAPTLCVGWGRCRLTAPSVFLADAEGRSRAVDRPLRNDELEPVNDAAWNCPTLAIELYAHRPRADVRQRTP